MQGLQLPTTNAMPPVTTQPGQTLRQKAKAAGKVASKETASAQRDVVKTVLANPFTVPWFVDVAGFG